MAPPHRELLLQLKEFKPIAMRSDQTDQSFAALIHLAAAVIVSRSTPTDPSLCESTLLLIAVPDGGAVLERVIAGRWPWAAFREHAPRGLPLSLKPLCRALPIVRRYGFRLYSTSSSLKRSRTRPSMRDSVVRRANS